MRISTVQMEVMATPVNCNIYTLVLKCECTRLCVSGVMAKFYGHVGIFICLSHAGVEVL